jgi:hypothetical protein
MTERMFAERADGVWMNPLARSGKFDSNSTAVDTTVESWRGLALHSLWKTVSRPEAEFGAALWTKSLGIVAAGCRFGR